MSSEDDGPDGTRTRRDFLKAAGLAAATTALEPWGSEQAVAEDGPLPTPTVQPRHLVMPKARLVLFGGGLAAERPIEVLESELEAAGKIMSEDDYDPHHTFRNLRKLCRFQGKTVVCNTMAYGDRAAEEAKDLRSLFTLLGAAKVITIANEAEANLQENADAIADRENTPLVYGSGGDQDLLQKFKGTKAHAELTKRYLDDPTFTLAVNSASTMALSRQMISNWNKENTGARIAEGLGFVEAILETHLGHAGRIYRLPRLLSAIAMHPLSIGIAIPVRTGFVVETNPDRPDVKHGYVMGPGTVLVVKHGEEKPVELTEMSGPYDLGSHFHMALAMQPETARAKTGDSR